MIDRDWGLRFAAIARVRELARGGLIRHDQLLAGFEFEGERIKLWDGRRGIWRPKQLGRDGAALTIVTVAPKPGQKPPYDDQVASADGWFVYRYEGTDPGLWTNRAVRRAMQERRPMIYLYGVVPGLYEAIYPMYVVADDPTDLAFRLAPDLSSSPVGPDVRDDNFEGRSAYATATIKARLHQRRFRELVVRAYRSTCTVCRLRHAELLDAAHILSYRDTQGRPDISNGLALCKIHHAAFDQNIMGIDPDFRVHIRHDVLEEEDGPMLRHGLQEMEGSRIVLPDSRASWPRREYLEERFHQWAA